MRKNLKELNQLIDQQKNILYDIRNGASPNSYTVECLNMEDLKSETTNEIDTAVLEISKVSEYLFYLKQLRNKANMETKVVIHDEEYNLIGLIDLIKILKEQCDYTEYLVAPRTQQIKKRLDSSIGKVVYSKFNGNVEALLKDLQELKQEIDFIQTQIDLLNITTYIEVE